MALSPDGKLLFSGCSDGKIEIWDLQGGEETTFNNTSAVGRLILSPDGKRVFASDAGRIHEFYVERRKVARTLRRDQDIVSSLAISSDGRRLFSGSKDKTINIYDLETGRVVATLRGHSVAVTSMAV